MVYEQTESVLENGQDKQGFLDTNRSPNLGWRARVSDGKKTKNKTKEKQEKTAK